jgi:hypothetical protein
VSFIWLMIVMPRCSVPCLSFQPLGIRVSPRFRRKFLLKDILLWMEWISGDPGDAFHLQQRDMLRRVEIFYRTKLPTK